MYEPLLETGDIFTMSVHCSVIREIFVIPVQQCLYIQRQTCGICTLTALLDKMGEFIAIRQHG
jgi:hypothetical protein